MKQLLPVFVAIAAAVLGAANSARATTAHPQKRALTIFAAASLADVLPKVAGAWKKAGGTNITFNFDASSRLAKQIAMGAPADAFFSADEEWMESLAKQDALLTPSRTDLLGNSLVLIVPAAKSSDPFTWNTIKKLGLAGEHVPAGKYARAALASEKLWSAVERKIVRGDNVRTVLTWVASGNIDAAVVYATDAQAAQEKVRVAYTFAPSSHPKIVYPAAVIKKSNAANDALAFLAFCKTKEAKDLFRSAGFRTDLSTDRAL